MKHDLSQGTVPLGIFNERVRVGDHVAYFWQDQGEFEKSCNFLIEGFRADDRCFVLGNRAMNRSVCDVLERRGIEIGNLRGQRRLRLLQPATSANATAQKLRSAFRQEVDRGAALIRLLVNISLDEPCWPKDEGLLIFEAKVTAAVKSFPSLVAWIYDESAPSGSMQLHGALKTHPMMVAKNVLRVNPSTDEIREQLAQRLQLRGKELNKDTLPAHQHSRRRISR